MSRETSVSVLPVRATTSVSVNVSSSASSSAVHHHPRDAKRRFRPAAACSRRSSRSSADNPLAFMPSAPLRELAWISRVLSALFATATPRALRR